eukprot:Lankesteria_metandrocarpae@DN3665_c0_g1_i1.p1
MEMNSWGGEEEREGRSVCQVIRWGALLISDSCSLFSAYCAAFCTAVFYCCIVHSVLQCSIAALYTLYCSVLLLHSTLYFYCILHSVLCSFLLNYLLNYALCTALADYVLLLTFMLYSECTSPAAIERATATARFLHPVNYYCITTIIQLLLYHCHCTA